MILYVALYIGAVVAANLLVATLGPTVSIFNAFVFIGLDLTVRDKLHDLFGVRNFALKMGVLIASGSVISALLNAEAANIAFASFIAFAASGSTDTLTYIILQGSSRFVKVNMSNMLSSLVDSFVFPTVAFGAVMPEIIVGQFLAKTVGGLLWYLLLNARRAPNVIWKT